MDGDRLPERTCVGCRGRGPKGSLLRVVRTPEGGARVDRCGRAPGRGAYVHPAMDCVRRAMRGGALARSLRTPLGQAQAASLVQELTEVLGAP